MRDDAGYRGAAAAETVVETVSVGSAPFGVAVTPDRSRAYVANFIDDDVSAIAIERCLGSLCIVFGSLTGSGSGAGSAFS